MIIRIKTQRFICSCIHCTVPSKVGCAFSPSRLQDSGSSNMKFPNDRYQNHFYDSKVLMVSTYYHLLSYRFKQLRSCCPILPFQYLLPMTFSFLPEKVEKNWIWLHIDLAVWQIWPKCVDFFAYRSKRIVKKCF